MEPPPPANGDTQRLTQFLLADIIGISADAIICIDSEQKITLFNDGAERIFGWTSEEVMGKPLDLLLPERARGAVHAAHVAQFRTAPEHARKMGQRRDISAVRKNGEEFPAEAAIAKVRMGDSVVFSVVLRDMTEQMALQKRLQHAVQARDDTVGVVAHDLRNPVSAVRMLATSLMKSGEAEKLSADGQYQVRLIADAAQQMDRLIQDLLDVMRVETGRLTLSVQITAVRQLLEGALQTLTPLIEEAGIELRVDAPSSLPAVSADPERVAQVLSNLVGNAIKFTARGGRITVTATGDAHGVRIAVTDTGTGISPEQLPNIFDRFWQTSQSTIRSRGAGLGLPIARGIVQAHGGRLWAESEYGKGSTFYFTLPTGALER